MSFVKKELAIFEVKGKRVVIFRAVTQIFNSIPLGSVEPERVFSEYGRTITKIRSSLHDESVDLLTFLRGYFKTENN
jgi:hypothetical protein